MIKSTNSVIKIAIYENDILRMEEFPKKCLGIVSSNEMSVAFTMLSEVLYELGDFFLCPPFVKVHTFWKDHNILRNLHRTFVLCCASQIYGRDFLKFRGLLIIYEIYPLFKETSCTMLFATDSSTILLTFGL